jgi:hypothetical protein
MNPALLDCLPFRQFDCRFDQAGMLRLRLSIHWITITSYHTKRQSPTKIFSAETSFIFAPESIELDSGALSENTYSNVLRRLTGRDGENVSRSLSDTMEAILPENIFLSSPTVEDMAILPQKPSSVTKFLKLSMYLISNNFFSSTTDVSMTVYRWVKRRSNAGLMEYILSIGGPTV